MFASTFFEMKKQIISLFLLFLLVAPAVVTYTWIQQRKRAVKKEVKWKMIAGIDKKELVLLQFSKQEIQTKLHWKHPKEFEFNHQMYDIVSQKSTKDSIAYWCWWDFEETKLNQQLLHLVAHQLQHDFPLTEKQSQLVDFYKSFFFQEPLEWQVFPVCVSITLYFLYSNGFLSRNPTLENPPPDGV